MKLNDLMVLQRQFSSSTRRQAFGVLEAIARSHEPTQTMFEQLESAYQSTGEFVADSIEFKDALIEIHPQGSRAIGTTTRPTAHTEIDIDLVARLQIQTFNKYSGYGGPKTLLDDLHNVLARYGARHDLVVKRRARCVTLLYSNDLHADITPVIDSPLQSLDFGDSHGMVPDKDLSRFLGTNPLGYRKWFDGVAKLHPIYTVMLTKDFSESTSASVLPLPAVGEVFDRFLCRIVQVVKIHRNKLFGDKASNAPTSIFLTTLVARLYQQLSQRPHLDELDLLLDIANMLPTAFERHRHADGTEEWRLLNPTTKNENVASRMNSPERQQGFWIWLDAFSEDLTKLSRAIQNNTGKDQLLLQVQQAFGSRSSDGLRNEINVKARGFRAQHLAILSGAAATPTLAPSRSHTFSGD